MGVTATFAPLRTLSVNFAGDGAGTVFSSPAGLSCRRSCSGQFPDGTTLTLHALADSGSAFEGWVGQDCFGTDACTVALDADRLETVKFEPAPPPPPPPPPAPPPPPFKPRCTVPHVVGLALTQAKTKIRRAHCGVGKVARKHAPKRKRNRVIAQSPRPGRRLANGRRVNLTVGR